MTLSTPIATQTPIRTEPPRWKSGTWEDYLAYRDDPTLERVRLFFNREYLFVDMGNEGINHSRVSDLFTLLFYIWFSNKSEQTAETLGRCLLEKPEKKAASPDLVLYVGEGVPQWKEGEPRRIDLSRWRVPDLVGEISDTTLATDLDEKKHLYAELEIPEYWVIDIRGKRVIAFRLEAEKQYKEVFESVALEKLPIFLLEQTLERLNEETNIKAANWFSAAIDNLNSPQE